MPSVSKAQQRFMGLVHAYKKGEVPASKVSKAVKDAAKSMKTKSTKKYASTKHKGLPNKVRQEVEDKLKEIIRIELEACGYTTSAINPEYDLKSPGGTGKEDKELKENIECLCEACQKGYMTHPTRKTKIMFGKRYRNCIKKETVTEDGHTDVASAERKLKIIMKDALETLNQLRTLSNEGELPSWWTDKITLAKDYVGKSRDYIMNPAESVNEGKLDRIASTLVADLNKEFTRYNPKKISDFNKVVKYLGKKMPRVPKSKIEDIAMTFDDIMRDEAGNVVVNSREQRARMKTTLKKLGMKESVNETPQKVAKLLIKYGNNPKDVKDMVKKHYKKAKKDRSKSTPSELANYISFLSANESVSEATSLGADMLLGGIATVIKKAGMRPKTAKMMGGGFKVSKRDKVGFKIDVEIRGMDKKKTFPLQFETERGMLYVVIKNKPIKLGKYTMVAQAAQNLKKVGTALIGDKDVKRIA